MILPDNLLHPGLHAFRLLFAQGAEIPLGDGDGRDDVSLAGDGDAHPVLVDLRALAAADQADIEGQIGFGQILAKAGDDASDFIDRAVARFGREDARAMPRFAGGGQRPAVGGAAGDGAHILAILLREAFEIERDVGALARCDEVGAGDRERFARILLVAGEHHLYIRVFERPCGLHRLEREQHGGDPALIVGRAGASGEIAIAREALKRRIGFEHGVEMADQQHLRRARPPLVRGDEMAGALGRIHGLPCDGEAQRFKLRAEHVGDSLHARHVHRSAILVHQLFEQGDGRLIARFDTLPHPAFGGAERGMGDRRAAQQQGGADERANHFASSALIAATRAGSSGLVVGAKRAATLPSFAIRNFSKFQRTSGASPGVMP